MFTLRDYQETAVQKGVEFFQKDLKPQLIVAPTAAGKSIIIASIAHNLDGRTIVLQPTKELLEQNYSKLIQMGGSAEIYSASMSRKEIGEITYATIGSIRKIGDTFKRLGFTNMIVDEAHLFPRTMASMFGEFMQSAQIEKVLGLTATAFRLQQNADVSQNLYFSKLSSLTSQSKKGSFYKDIIHITQIEEMVKRGFWSPIEHEVYDIDTGMLKFNSSGSDFTDSSVDKYFRENDIYGNIKRRIAVGDRKKTLVFVPRVADAINLSSQTPYSAAVYGDMSKKERSIVIDKYKSGEIRTVFNVNVLSVGFDYPEIDCIICGRPTSSLAWWYQAAGRGTRIHPDKKDCLIVDFSGNVEKFGNIENLYYKKHKRTWNVCGEGGRVLTNIPLSEVGWHWDGKGKYSDDKDHSLQAQNGAVTFTFGKFKGQTVEAVSKENKGYLSWMIKEFEWKDWNMPIKNEIERLMQG
jgi:DNA repair protein RadD